MQSELIGSKFVRVVRKKRPQWHLEEEKEEEAGEALSGRTTRQTPPIPHPVATLSNNSNFPRGLRIESTLNRASTCKCIFMYIYIYYNIYIHVIHVYACIVPYNHHTRAYPIRLVVCWMLRSWCLNACMGGQKHINVLAVAVVVVALQSLSALHLLVHHHQHHRLPSSKPNMQVNASNDWFSCFLFLLS